LSGVPAKLSERAALQAAVIVDSKGDPMAWMIKCECGEVARAETDEELISAVERHVQEQHPEMVGRLTRDQILEMAEVV
jgi:predicted small metal-binding protein